MEQMRHLFLVPCFGICWVMLRSGLFLLAGRNLTIISNGASGDVLMSYFSDGTSTGKSNTVILQPDLSVELPHDGILYRLGNLHKQRIDVDSSRLLRIRKINPNANLKYDMLHNDFRGAFDQTVTAKNNGNMIIPWREPHEPLFLVVYGNQTDFQVEYVEAKQHHFEGNSNDMEVYNFPRRDLFYRKRSGSGGKVTLCTQITPERLQYLSYIVKNWGGPVSAVVFVGYRGNQVEELAEVAKFWDDIIGENVRANLDLHIVYDDKRAWYSTTSDPKSNLGNNPYPVNLLRQISVDNANTEWVLMMEGDMLTPPNGHALIEDSWDSLTRAYGDNGGAAFVVPLYRVRKPIDEETFEIFPKDKQELLKVKHNILRSKNKRVDITNDYFRASKTHRNQGLCDYDSWETLVAKSDTFLPYHESGEKGIICDPPEGHTEQEPYSIIRRQDMPPFNSLFAGMWWDKTTHIIDSCNCGLTFLLHPTLFTVLFSEPQGSARSGVWGGHIPNWRQEFVFAMGPVFAQEYQKSRLANGANRTMCSRVADIPAGQPQPYRPWVPAWVNSTRNGQLRRVHFAEHLQWVEDMQKQKAALKIAQ